MTRQSWGSIAACVFLSGAAQSALAGSLLPDIEKFASGQYPVATAYLDLYDPDGVLVGSQGMDATALLSAGYVSTGTELVFNGSLTFPDVYPTVAGGSGGFLATVHDFSIDLDTALNSPGSDLVTLQIDWVSSDQAISETWGLVIGDDFVNGIAYYTYSGSSPQALAYGSANFSLEFATGIPPVPLPAAVWMFGSGLLGLIVAARRRRPA